MRGKKIAIKGSSWSVTDCPSEDTGISRKVYGQFPVTHSPILKMFQTANSYFICTESAIIDKIFERLRAYHKVSRRL